MAPFHLTLTSRAPDSTAPLPEATSYALPYGYVGLINNLVAIFMLGCLTQYRSPLFPWRQLQHRRLSANICLAWSISTFVVQGINLVVGARSGSLVVIIIGRVILSFLFSLVAVGGVWNHWKGAPSNTESQAVGQDSETRTDGEGESVAVRAGETNTETETRSEEPPEVSTAEETGTPDEGRASKADHVELLHRSPTQEVPVDQTEPPPAYESISRETFPPAFLFTADSEHAPLNPSPSTLETQTAYLVNAGTQTDPLLPLSPTAAAQALGTNVTSGATPTDPGAPQKVNLEPIPTIVGATFFAIFPGLIFGGATSLAVAAVRAGSQEMRSVVVIFGCLFGAVLAPFLFVAFTVGGQAMWECWKEFRAKKGQYAELAQMEDGEARGAASGVGENQDGGGESSTRREEGIENVTPDHARPAQIEVTEESKQGPKTSERVQSALSMYLLLVLFSAEGSVLFSDFVLGAANANMSGLPIGKSIFSTVLWVAYIVLSKLPMLCI